jgi:hypothetical protein
MSIDHLKTEAFRGKSYVNDGSFALNKAVTRNIDRSPPDFVFRRVKSSQT